MMLEGWAAVLQAAAALIAAVGGVLVANRAVTRIWVGARAEVHAHYHAAEVPELGADRE